MPPVFKEDGSLVPRRLPKRSFFHERLGTRLGGWLHQIIACPLQDATEQVHKKAKRSSKKTKKKCKHRHQPGAEEEDSSSLEPVCETTEIPGSGKMSLFSLVCYVPLSFISHAVENELREHS